MSNAIEIFNNKLISSDLTGSTRFFNNLEEVKQFNSLQDKYISNVNYSILSNFAIFGSAVEYYNNAYNYFNSEYPYDSSTVDKLSWINNLNDFEYYMFSKHYPRSTGYSTLSSSQYIKVSSHVREIQEDAKNVYDSSKKNYYYNELNFDNGITYEAWMNFEDEWSDSNILQIQAITGSSGVLSPVNILTIYRNTSGTPHFSIKDEISSTVFNFSTEIQKLKWQHYAFTVFSDKLLLYVNGQLKEEIKNITLSASNDTYIFGPYGLMFKSVANTSPSMTLFNEQYVFKIGGDQKFSLDESRLWNGERSLEKIGRFWFTNIDGNDFNDSLNSNLVFYYKFNEGWDQEYLSYCLDYSGRKNDAEIINYTFSCRSTGSAISESDIVQDIEEGDIVYKGLQYSSNTVTKYNFDIEVAKDHDSLNTNLLYNKFPSWILEEEQENESKHLKQLIQIVSSYFDDLYNKIKEMTNYKNINYNLDKTNIYPFYDKILSSTGFNVTDLFTNLDIVEKISSRNDQTLFDDDIKKIKNGIFQNIYNNISYIFKSKGTQKSLKSFLRSYGIDENLIKINLYADKALYDVKERYSEVIVKKKTVTMTNSNIIYLNSLKGFQENADNKYYTLEISTSFPKLLKNSAPLTSSLFGFHSSNSSFDLDPSSTTHYQYYSYVINDPQQGSKICVTDGVNVSSSAYYKDFYDDTVWNICFRKRPDVDVLAGAPTSLNYILEFYAVNKNSAHKKEFMFTFPYSPQVGHIRYYIGARCIPYDFQNATYNANSKFLYCNFWDSYLNNSIITSHNMDILNYGVDE